MSDDSKIEVCDCYEVHDKLIDCVKKTMLDEDTFVKLSSLFKVLGDYTRIKTYICFV